MEKFICLILFFLIIVNVNPVAHAKPDFDSEVESNAEIAAQAEETVENILNEFENNSDELQKKVDDVIEENSDNWLVKIFKKIIDAISEFLDAIFEIALEATKTR